MMSHIKYITSVLNQFHWSQDVTSSYTKKEFDGIAFKGVTKKGERQIVYVYVYNGHASIYIAGTREFHMVFDEDGVHLAGWLMGITDRCTF